MQSLIKKRQPKSSQTKLAAVLPVPDFIPTIAPRVIAAVSALPPPLSESNGNVSRLDGVRAAEEFRQSAHKLEIESIEFSFFSTERIRQLSVVECRDSRTEGNNSVNSPNMGTNSRFESCGTCGLTDIDCPGHLGRIELATPIIHPLAIDYAILVLQSICSSCGRLLLPECRRNDPSLLRLPTAMRLREIARLVSSSNTITCPYNLELAARRSNPIEGMEEFEDQDKVFLETYTQLKEAIPLLIGEIAHEQAESLLAASSAENARNRNSPTARKNRETAKKRSDKVVSLNNSLNEIVREVDEKKSNWLNVLEKPLNVLEITYDISNLRATVVNLERLIEIINKLLSSPDSDQILKPVLQDTLDSTNKTLVEMKTLLIEAESAPIRNHFCPPTIPKYSTPKDSDALQIFAVSKSLVTKQLIRRIVSPESAKTLFNAIPIADLAVLGFNGDSHPRNFIMEMLPVIPERNRPPAERDGEFKPDHITVCYQIIIRDNCRLKNMLEKRDRDRKEGLVTSENEISTATRTLAFCISRLFNNSDSKLKIRHNEAAVTFGSRLTGKEGFCRAYAQGKRANFSGRSVIGPGIVPFGGLIIPGAMRVLTVPEKVHALNFLQIRKAAEAGRIIHHTPGPGQPKAGTRTRYTKARQAAIALGLPPPTLEIGDLVERLGSTGDEVFVNRQPTLHRHSIIGCRAIHHSAKKTIQMHMAYTKGMNADFDGDEANINVPQTLESRAELRHLMGADRQIVTNASSRPIMGLVYNAPTSAYLLSSDAEEDDRAGFISNPITVADLREITSVLLNDDSRAKTLLERASKYGISPQSPRYMISLTFPSTFTYKRQYEHEDVDPQDLTKTITVQREITIIDGVFIKGILSKEDISEKLIHAIYLKYGRGVAGRFISEAQFILDWYLERRGFSIGLMDMLLTNPVAAKSAVMESISKIRVSVAAIEATEAVTELEKKFQEEELQSVLESVLLVGKKMSAGDIAGSKNPLGIMVRSGAKGGPNNIARIAGAVGEQFVSGNRPPLSIPGNRALCYFEAGEKSIESRGFATHSYAEGLTPAEFFFHMGGSRIGLLDTSMKTAEIGAIQHRVSKVLENDRTNHFGGVVNSSGVYTSLSYGEGFACDELVYVKSFVSTGPIFMPFDLRSIASDLNA